MTITINGTTGIAGVDGSAGTPALQGSDTNTGVFFGTDTVTVSTGGTAAVTVDSGQRTKFPTTIGVGNATPSTSGSGVSFPATQSASSDANTLDDYEEGTFDYTMPCSTSGSYTVRSGYTKGFYTKIGRLVTVNIRYESQGSSSPVGNLQIAGLPFARTSNPSGGVSDSNVPFLVRGSTGTIASFYGYLGASSTTIIFYKQGTDGAYSGFAVADVSGGSGGAVEGAISITYEV